MKLTLENPMTIEGSSEEIAKLIQFLAACDVFDNLDKLKAELEEIERGDAE